METNNLGKRLDFLDIAKGIGIIFVLYSHSSGFPIFHNAVVDFYMPLFFCVSGYVYKSGRTPATNIKRKLKQLVIPYVGYTLLLYAEHILIKFIKHELTKEAVLKPLLGAAYSRAFLYADLSGENVEFMLLSNGPMWFITAMAVASVIFYLLVDRFLANKTNMIAITACLCGVTVVFTYCPYLLPWSVDTAFACALFMLMGAKMGQLNYYSDENKKQYAVWFVALAALVYCVLTEVMNPLNISLRDYGYPGVVGAFWFLAVASAGTVIFLWICKHIEGFGWTKIFIIVGRHTFSIMALHIFLVKYLNKAYYLFGMTFSFERSCIWYWVYWAAIYVAVILLCILFDVVVSRVRAVAKSLLKKQK